MTVRVIDIETSDLDKAKAHVIEIAAVDLVPANADATWGETDWRCRRIRARYVALPEGAAIAPEASAVHHLLSEDLDTAPSLQEVIDDIKGDGEQVDCYVAHNAEFERFFLDRHLGHYVPWVCTWKCSLRAWPDFPSHSNQALRYRLGLYNPMGLRRDGIVPHQASNDAVVTGAIFTELTKIATRAQLLEWTEAPALLTIVNFGMYRGQRFTDVPTDYLEWVATARDLREEQRYAAAHELARRKKQMEGAA